MCSRVLGLLELKLRGKFCFKGTCLCHMDATRRWAIRGFLGGYRQVGKL